MVNKSLNKSAFISIVLSFIRGIINVELATYLPQCSMMINAFCWYSVCVSAEETFDFRHFC